jgi:hypothetical protein
VIWFETTRVRYSFRYDASLFNKVSKGGPFIGFLEMSLGDLITGNIRWYDELNMENKGIWEKKEIGQEYT